MNRKKKYVIKSIQLGIGILCILILLFSFNIREVVSTILSINLIYIIPAVICYCITFIILTIRWDCIIKNLGYRVPFFLLFQAFSSGILLSDITPGRIGDFARPSLITRYIPLSPGFVSYIIDRYSDFITKLFLCFGVFFLVSNAIDPTAIEILLLISVLPVLAGGIMWVLRHKTIRLIEPLLIGRLKSYTMTLLNAFNDVKSPYRLISVTSSLTFCAAIMHGIRIYCIALSTGYPIPIPDLVVIQSLISSFSLVPFTISGLGLVEGGLSAAFSVYQVPLAAGLAIALIDRFLTVGFHLITGLPLLLSGDESIIDNLFQDTDE